MIYVSSAAVNSSSLEDSVNTLAGICIRNIELSGGLSYSDNILKKLKGLKKKFSLNLLIHNYFPPSKKEFVLNIASNNKGTRLKSINFVKRSIDLAHDLEIDCYTLHPGYTRELRAAQESDYFIADGYPGISPAYASAIMFETLLEIREYAVMRGVRIGLENLFPIDDAPDSSLLCTPAEIIQFLDYFSQDDNIGFLLDLGHLVISANYFGFDKDEFIETLSKGFQDKIFEIHLSGNDGKKDEHVPLAPDCWQLRAVRRFDLGKIPITIECRGIKTTEILSQYQMVKNILRREG
jgi:sugar phosphate isomerase/epimerase